MSTHITTWRKKFQWLFDNVTGDTFEDLVTTLPDDQLDVEFDCGFGLEEMNYFIAWSDNWIYEYHEYDGAESIATTRRNPTEDAHRIGEVKQEK